MNLELILGDTLDELKKRPDESVHFVCTSPPYPGVEKMWGKFFAADNFENAHLWLDQVWDECIRILKPGCKLAVQIGNVGRRPALPNGARVMMYKNPLAEFIGHIVWIQGKESGNTAWGTYANPTDPALTDGHEFIIVFRKQGERVSPNRSRPVMDKMDFMSMRQNIWNIPTESAKRVGHIAPFPVEIPRRLITFYTFENEFVIDPFVGSGSSGIAAGMLNRQFIGIDHDPKSIELARYRIENSCADRGEIDRPLKYELTQVAAF